MDNYKAPGKILKLTAPSGGVVSGLGYKIGSLVVLATFDAAQTEKFSALVEGEATVVKATGATWSEGEKIYWDNSAKKFTPTSSGNTLVGVATAAAGSSDTTGKVRLDGVAR